MRVDGKQEGPRQSMAWLHTWASLILGWLLYAIFVTGTLSFFQSEISVWMKPEFHQSVPPSSQIKQTQVALNYLKEHHPDAASWTIQLPNARQNTTFLNVRSQGENPNARRGGTRINIDSATGEVLKARETRGGTFLYRFHFDLYGISPIWARWIVGFATMLMLVAIISGIITHKKIFKDFFTFRTAKGQRSWLDAHNATAVFALPFHIMITFSGLLLLMFIIMPWGVNQVYESRGQFIQDQRKSLIEQPQDNTEHKRARLEHGKALSKQQGQTRRQIQAQQPAPLADFAPIFAQAEHEWQNNPVGSIRITKPNTDKATIELTALNGISIAYRNLYPSLEFNGVTGKLNPDQTVLKKPSTATGIYNIVTSLHEARGVDLALRWLLFLSGILGTLMVATGLILWCVKRAPQQQKQGYKSFGYRTVEVLNITAVIGLPLACAAYFYANRLLPAELDLRAQWEIRSFFSMWLLTFFYALIRTHRSAWLELLAFASLVFALLPILNFMTGGQAIWNTIAKGQWVIASFDLAMWLFALIFYFAFKRVKNHKGLPAKKLKNSPVENES